MRSLHVFKHLAFITLMKRDTDDREDVYHSDE